ncbi:MAG TPA: amidohydrolase family protein, partial [Saprospiraceae bacterium]|nr:amidohydrolase family protein [Saprospiraceae bacterium]
TAASSGRVVAAHAGTAEGMRRATLAGVKTIEHGDDGTLEVFRLMKEKGVALCPTLAAGDAISRYRGWDGRPETEPQRIKEKKESFRLALESGVTIIAGGDVGVFPHGENARELELMVEYGMAPLAVLRSATAVNAAVFELPELGLLQPGFLADIIAVEGDPLEDIHSLRKVALVMKDGVVVRH